MNIIEKDINWLIQKVPDFESFYYDNYELFQHDGYVAGGFLRKIITYGSVEAVKTGMATGKIGGDIDWFFHSPTGCQSAWNDFVSLYNKNLANIKEPNSFTKFAFEGFKRSFKNNDAFSTIKYQLIYKSYGIPSTVLNRFDISNCKIATNGKKVWMVEDWEELEQNKFIRVDNFAGQYLIPRLKKYIVNGFSVLPSQKEEILLKMLQSIEKYSAAIKQLISCSDIVSVDSILLFYRKLGDYREIVDPTEYAKGTLGQTQDFALHMYERKNAGHSSDYR